MQTGQSIWVIPIFWDVLISELLDDDYIADRVNEINQEKATNSEAVRAMKLDNTAESEETTHYSIIDTEGNAVSLTTTISAYASKLFVEDSGFLMNNEMDDFSKNPESPTNMIYWEGLQTLYTWKTNVKCHDTKDSLKRWRILW